MSTQTEPQMPERLRPFFALEGAQMIGEPYQEGGEWRALLQMPYGRFVVGLWPDPDGVHTEAFLSLLLRFHERARE